VLFCTPVPPLATGKTPVVPASIGKLEQLDRLPDDGVPNAGEVKLGELERTTLPDPVEPVTPVPPLATGKVPVTPAVSDTIGKLVQLDKLPDEGVPNAGEVRLGELERTTLPDPVLDVTPVPPLATDKVPVVPASIGSPVQLVNEPDAGVPRAGVTSAGDVAKTSAPVPVSPVTAAASCAEVKDPSDVALPTDVTAPVKLALVVTFPAVKLAAVPVKPVPAPENEDAVVAPVTTSVPPTVALPDMALWASTISVPLHTRITFLPLGTDTPVNPVTLTVTANPPVVLLYIK
jgi:hypothetical protein